MDSSTRQLQIFIEQLGLMTLEYSKREMSSDASILGTHLFLISGGLGTVNPQALANGDIPQLNKVIAMLEPIAKITGTSYPSAGNQAHTDRPLNNLAEYFKSSHHKEGQELSKDCEDLSDALWAHPGVEHLLANPPKSGKIEYPMSVKRRLLSSLRNNSICTCVGPDESQGSPRWHPTRLLLPQKPREDNCKTVDFNAIVARIPQECWQDSGLSVPLENWEGCVGESSPSSGPKHGRESGPIRGLFCTILMDNVFARSCFVFRNGHFSRLPKVQALEQQPCPGIGITLTAVLKQYTLRLKDKVDLAHMMAQALWQFYDTWLLHDKWNSDCILFMPEEHEGVQRVPIKPYVSIQFEVAERNLDERLSEDSHVHQHPRILAFAIMLIEIGLGRPLQLRQCNSLAAQVNADHNVASQGLEKLKETSWENSSSKDVFIQAIANCLWSDSYKPVHTVAAVPSPAENQNGRTSLQIDHTRRVFYDKVVWPLKWLAKSEAPGHQSAGYLRENQRSLQISRTLSTREGLKEDIQLPSTEFHGTDHIYSKFQELVVSERSIRVDEMSIRVAILDTGYDPKAPQLARKAAARCFKGWKDFVSGSDVPVDSFGHGTFMATVLIHSFPMSEVHVARVAENTDKLRQSPSRVAQGIRWAALEQNADIISMSFGFPASDIEAYKQISEAIEEVKMKRDGQIIFLASAGNSGVYEDETFPATHPFVISIRATNSSRQFMNTNPRNRSGDGVAFGAIGDDLPLHLRDFRPEVSLPGTSAATAVAAGTAAIMLTYVQILPHLLEMELDEILKQLWTTEGMRKMFMKISDDMAQQQRFLNPVKFFLDKPNPFRRYCAIVECL
ncbi:peptidase S8/S53 domain-containing protein [Trichoderma pleuroticola]